MTQRIFIAALIFALSGCSTTYLYDGQQYRSPEKFYAAIDSSISKSLEEITPLPSAISTKKLVFAIPSHNAFAEVGRRNFIKQLGKEPTPQQLQIARNLDYGNIKNITVFYDAVKKRNIFASAQYVETDLGAGVLAASPDTDTLTLVLVEKDSIQWFYNSEKNGKQVFAYDRSPPTVAGKLKTFIEAVQMQAIRD